MTFDLTPFRRLYPFESNWLDVGGVQMHYVDEGPRDADPVLCVHGNPTWSFFYRELIAALRTTHRVIAADHVGCGLSDKPSQKRYEFTLDRRIRDLQKLLDHLEINENLTLVVHDWGGMIGTAVALRHPERIRALVALNTAAFLKPPAKCMPWQLAFVRTFKPLAKLLVCGLNAFVRGTLRVGATRHLPAEVWDAYVAPHNSWKSRLSTLRFVQDIPLGPKDASYRTAEWVDQNLEQLANKPVLLGWGMQDFVFDELFLDEWRRRFPAAEVHTFPHAGHLLLEDEPEQLIPLIRQFVDRHSAARSTAPEAGTST